MCSSSPANPCCLALGQWQEGSGGDDGGVNGEGGRKPKRQGRRRCGGCEEGEMGEEEDIVPSSHKESCSFKASTKLQLAPRFWQHKTLYLY